jgi:hypothetical protein
MRKLLKEFGSPEQVKATPIEALAASIGPAAARKVVDWYKG